MSVWPGAGLAGTLALATVQLSCHQSASGLTDAGVVVDSPARMDASVGGRETLDATSPDLTSFETAADAPVVDVAPSDASVVDVAREQAPMLGAPAASALVQALDLARFKENIRALACCGDRTQGSASFGMAMTWLEGQLKAAGYEVQILTYTYSGQMRRDLWVTKVGKTHPERMYMVTAHLDGRGGGGGADDDGSGVSLVLEAARAFARPDIETEVSVRFIFWDNEETGLNGSRAYATTRGPLQGKEEPPGSGRFPEPQWLGLIQHDMILFDHGLPPGPQQSPGADIDVEFQATSPRAAESRALAAKLMTAAAVHATEYPVEVGSNMQNTDSATFQGQTASVSVRENQRVTEIGKGANPNWHRNTDRYETYSEADFRLGFTTVKMTTGAVAELAGARFATAP